VSGMALGSGNIYNAAKNYRQLALCRSVELLGLDLNG
jgi:hypothetical protein